MDTDFDRMREQAALAHEASLNRLASIEDYRGDYEDCIEAEREAFIARDVESMLADSDYYGDFGSYLIETPEGCDILFKLGTADTPEKIAEAVAAYQREVKAIATRIATSHANRISFLR